MLKLFLTICCLGLAVGAYAATSAPDTVSYISPSQADA